MMSGDFQEVSFDGSPQQQSPPPQQFAPPALSAPPSAQQSAGSRASGRRRVQYADPNNYD